MEKPKVHMNDILESEVQEPIKILVLGDKKYYADRTTKEELSTHRDCEKCGNEFKKDFTFDKHCFNCKSELSNEKFKSLQLVEWDGKSAVVLFRDDTYFFDEESVVDYCNDNEIKPSELQLCLCEETTFRTVDLDFWQDDVHEDWEADQELTDLVNALNKYLQSASTNTWIPTNKRVDFSFLDELLTSNK